MVSLQRVSVRAGCLIAGTLALAACGGGGYDNPPPISFTPYEVNLGLAVMDFNGDGLPDVLTAQTLHQPTVPFESGTLNIHLHNAGASAGFAASGSVAAGTEPLYLAGGDLNGDGLPDVVSASFDDGQLAVYLNQKSAPGTFAAPVLLPSPGASQVVIADLNGDGLPDLVSADYGVSVFLQDPAHPGTFLAPFSLSAAGANWVAVGDLNHDGLPDIVVTDATGVHLYLHAATATSATFMTPVTVFTQTLNQDFQGANDVAIADVNGDGYNDLVITDPGPFGPAPPTVNILLQDATHPGTFLAGSSYPVPMGRVAQFIELADLNADGHPDIIYGDSAGVSVLLQNAAVPGTFAAASFQPVPYGAFQTGVADVNGDGLKDIVVTSAPAPTLTSGTYQMQPGVLLQNGAVPGTFAALQTLP